jgi:DNA (cytosine-5)-methyltransferase 1
VLNAAYLGTPQARDRLVIVGIRGDVAAAAGETSDALMPPPLPWRPWTVREALSDCPVRWPSSIDARSLSYARAIPPGRNRAAITGLIGFSFKRHLMDRPAYTIPAEGGANGSWYGDIHPTEHRKLHGSELMRLGGFPDQWAWESRTTDEIHHRIGNSVPPPMMERVADRVLAVLKAARPRGRSGRKGGRRK